MQKPIAASLYLSLPTDVQKVILEQDRIPVNDKLLPIWEDYYDLLLLYGGRGGGKSESVVDKKLNECLDEPYFKCYYGRKVFDTVRGSCFATLVASIKKNNMEHLFHYSESDSSSMVITCTKNGNKFIPFGSDKADKLKSIKDPTDIWCEEFDQFTFNDFKELYPTLRTPRGRNRFTGTFNTHGVLPNHWLLKIFFPELYQGTDKSDVEYADLLEGKQVKKLFVNFTDNYFIDQKAYRQTLWLSAAGNLTIYEGIANGAWGIQANDNPWAFAFDRKKHVAMTELRATRSEYLWLSFDFNRSPAACTVIQRYNETIYVIECIKLMKSGTDAVCDYILANYPGYIYLVTGDYSGTTASSIFKEEVTNYTVIINKLNLAETQLKIAPNPRLEKNRILVNAVLFRTKVQMCPVKARPLIFDMENAKVRADGTIIKENRDDPAQQLDFMDDFRYYVNADMQWVLNMEDDIPPPEETQMPQISTPTVTTSKYIDTLSKGGIIECNAQEYPIVRNELLTAAGQWLDAGDAVRAQIALLEVKRLDKIFKIIQ